MIITLLGESGAAGLSRRPPVGGRPPRRGRSYPLSLLFGPPRAVPHSHSDVHVNNIDRSKVVILDIFLSIYQILKPLLHNLKLEQRL